MGKLVVVPGVTVNGRVLAFAPEPPPKPVIGICGCGAPATEVINFGNGDVRIYCRPCS